MDHGSPVSGEASPPVAAFRKTLSTRHGVVIALANISPTVSVGIGLAFLAALAGTAMPAAFLLAALPILAVSGGYARLAARDPNCGTAYVWVRRALGPWTGYLTGWTSVATNILFLSYAGQLTGQFTVGLLAEAGITALSPDDALAVTATGLVWSGLIVVSALRGCGAPPQCRACCSASPRSWSPSSWPPPSSGVTRPPSPPRGSHRSPSLTRSRCSERL